MRQKKVIAFDWDDTLAPADVNPQLFPCVKEMLEYLNQNGYEILIITAREKPENIRAVLDQNQLNFITDENISSPHNVAARFPGEEKFARKQYEKADILEKHRIQKNYQKEDYLLVDDHPGHVKKAQDAGYEAVKVEHISDMRPVPRADFFKELTQQIDNARQQKAALRNYISEREVGAKYLNIFRSGVDKDTKLAAARATLTNLENGTAIGDEHQKALGQGRLGKLYQSMCDNNLITEITAEALREKRKTALLNYIRERDAGAKYLSFFNLGVDKDAKLAAARAVLSNLENGTAIGDEHQKALGQGRLGKLYQGMRN